MSGLDEKGLEAAVQAGNRLYIDADVGSVPTLQTYRTIIRAYLSAVGQKAGTVEVKADGDLLDQAVAFAEMWGTEQNWPHVRDAYMAAILRERAKLSLRSPSGKTIPNYPEYDNARSR